MNAIQLLHEELKRRGRVWGEKNNTVREFVRAERYRPFERFKRWIGGGFLTRIPEAE